MTELYIHENHLQRYNVLRSMPLPYSELAAQSETPIFDAVATLAVINHALVSLLITFSYEPSNGFASVGTSKENTSNSNWISRQRGPNTYRTLKRCSNSWLSIASMQFSIAEQLSDIATDSSVDIASAFDVLHVSCCGSLVG